MREITSSALRAWRLQAHRLDSLRPMGELEAAAGACGLQNSPPGAWETALFNRLEGCTRAALDRALWEEKRLLQAWSIRGVPLVFPAAERGVFLSPLAARPGEEPWIYTRGISAALDFLGLSFDQLLPLAEAAVSDCLRTETVRSKEALDQVVADAVEPMLPPEKRSLWRAPSLYGRPDRQTVGGAAVSFLLRPCAFRSLVVFGRREEGSPTFTSLQNWLGAAPAPAPAEDRLLVRKFLRCYGPASPAGLAAWLGASPRQARRLWDSAAEEMAPVRVEGRTRWALAEDVDAMAAADCHRERLLLLGPHDPYLDLRDRELILEDAGRQRLLWRTVGNPGAILRGGRVVGAWTAKSIAGRLEAELTLWEPLPAEDRRQLEALAERYGAFRVLPLRRCALREG